MAARRIPLTKKQRAEVLEHLRDGYSPQQVAGLTSYSRETIRTLARHFRTIGLLPIGSSPDTDDREVYMPTAEEIAAGCEAARAKRPRPMVGENEHPAVGAHEYGTGQSRRIGGTFWNL